MEMILVCWHLSPEAYLLMQQIKGKLQANCSHVILLKGTCHVHVHVEKPLHGAALLPRLLYLQL